MRVFRSLFSCSVLLLMPALAGAQSAPDAQPAAMQGFGAVVAVGDNEIVVGEPRNLFRPGMVYIYRKADDGGWHEAAQLTAPEAETLDRFGRSLGISGTTMLVGADPQREETAGLVYWFERDAAGYWQSAGQLSPSDGMAGDGFGAALLVGEGGGVALVGAPSADSTGAVYVFVTDGSGWREAGQLTSAEAAAGDAFGSALALSGDHLLVGAPGHDDGAGAVVHFHRIGTEWVEQGKLPGNDEPGARFGSAITLTADRAFVGIPRSNNRAGAVGVYAYDTEEGQWSEVSSLVPFDGGRRTSFGSAIAVSDGAVWIGTPGANAIHAFSHDQTGWTGVQKILPPDSRNARSFGSSLAVGGGVAVVGVTGADNGAGTAMVFELGGDGWAAVGTLLSEPEGLDEITGTQVDCSEGLASDYDCEQVDLVSFLPVRAIGGQRGTWLNDLWGWTDPETGREYALIGRVDGTSFVDMTDPLNPRYLGDLPKTDSAPSSVWRDIKVYRDHAYIVADGAPQHGMQVFDLTELRNVGSEPVTFTEVYHYDLISSAHNIVINEETGFAYIVGSSRGGTTCGGGLHMVDIREPAEPKFAGCFSDGVTGRRGTGYSHDAQCVTYTGPDEDYQGSEICIGANETAISFADVTDKDNPIAISNVAYPNVAYAHQGWLTDDQRYFYSNDEGDEPNGSVSNTRTLVWDVSDLDDPILVNEYFAPTTETDHNLYVLGDYMYQSNYGAGFRIIDISDRENPVEVGYFDTSPERIGCCGTWSNYPYFESGVIPVTGGNAGIFFLRKHEAPVP